MADLTVDGVIVREGLRVFTNNARWGTVKRPSLGSPGWWDVDEDGGTSPMLNGERMATRSPFGDLDPREA